MDGKAPCSCLFFEPLGPGFPYLDAITQEKFLVSDAIMGPN